MKELEALFNTTTTENGDIAYKSTGDIMLDILFKTEYLTHHLDEVEGLVGDSAMERLFAMFIRDPRYGLGRRDLGRALMRETNCGYNQVVTAGRYDDLFHMHNLNWKKVCETLWAEVQAGNELVKKWMPRFNGKGDDMAKQICQVLHISQKAYRKAIKCDTTERLLTEKRLDEINYEHVPSLAMIKYAHRFNKELEYKAYLEGVKAGTKKLNISTATIYDIYRNRKALDADVFVDKLEKISLSCIPVLDTSGSMYDGYDSIGKAMSIAWYLAKCSTYCPNQVISFSSQPQLMTLTTKQTKGRDPWGSMLDTGWRPDMSNFEKELCSMYTGDCSTTNLSAVMDILMGLKTDFPDYIVVLSDMQFNAGSGKSKDQLMAYFRSIGAPTKILWWNFCARDTACCPETDKYGNIFFSGYNPMLLKFLELGFDGKKFLIKLLEEYDAQLTNAANK